jgi:hypothetical protein
VVGILGRELGRARAEIRLERGDRPGPFSGVLPVFPEHELGVVASGRALDHLLEERHSFGGLACAHELGPERGEHVDIVGSERTSAPHQRDPGGVLAERRVHRGAQDVRLEPARIEPERLVERRRRRLVVAPPQRLAPLLDEHRAVVLALAAALSLGDRWREREREHANRSDNRGAHTPPSLRQARSG